MLLLGLGGKKVFIRNNSFNFRPNPMAWPSLESSLRDSSNEWSHHRIWLSINEGEIKFEFNIFLHFAGVLHLSLLLYHTVWCATLQERYHRKKRSDVVSLLNIILQLKENTEKTSYVFGALEIKHGHVLGDIYSVGAELLLVSWRKSYRGYWWSTIFNNRWVI